MWRKCSSCKAEIEFNSKYYVCSVSTCTGQRTGYVFCSVPCWERHLPTARHKDAAAIEMKAPSERAPEAATSSGGSRRIVRPSTEKGQFSPHKGKGNSHEILVVASKLKQYVKDVSDMNTSQSVLGVLSDLLRREADKAIEKARADGRKTVLDRDFR